MILEWAEQCHHKRMNHTYTRIIHARSTKIQIFQRDKQGHHKCVNHTYTCILQAGSTKATYAGMGEAVLPQAVSLRRTWKVYVTHRSVYMPLLVYFAWYELIQIHTIKQIYVFVRFMSVLLDL